MMRVRRFGGRGRVALRLRLTAFPACRALSPTPPAELHHLCQHCAHQRQQDGCAAPGGCPSNLTLPGGSWTAAHARQRAVSTWHQNCCQLLPAPVCCPFAPRSQPLRPGAQAGRPAGLRLQRGRLGRLGPRRHAAHPGRGQGGGWVQLLWLCRVCVDRLARLWVGWCLGRAAPHQPPLTSPRCLPLPVCPLFQEMVERLRPDLLPREYSVRADLPQIAFRWGAVFRIAGLGDGWQGYTPGRACGRQRCLPASLTARPLPPPAAASCASRGWTWATASAQSWMSPTASAPTSELHH